jgi:type III pantothenate kinase
MLTKEILLSIIENYPVKYVIISSVAEIETALTTFLEANLKLINFSHQTKLPVTILYKNAESLGLDRIANAVGAAALFPNSNVLSIQAGTCLVCDFVNKNREYLGGSISPGVKMRLTALHEKTKKLPMVTVTEEDPHFLGTDTNNAVLSGVINGICYEIDGFIYDYQKQFNDLKVIITGGDSFFLQKFIKNTIFAAPNIVLQGLNEIINNNV